MKNNNTVGLSAIIGMAVGIILFAVGNSLTPDYLILKAINVIQLPLVPVVTWIQGASHGWGSDGRQIYKLLLVMMGYWTLLGISIGLGCRLLLSRKSRHAA